MKLESLTLIDHKMIILVLLYVAAVVSAKKVAPYSLSEGPQHFEDFIDTHNKVYSSDEEKAMRYQIFLKNLDQINQLNAKYEHTGYSVNQFTDLTLQEFQAMHKCFKAPSEYLGDCNTHTPEIKNMSYAPDNFDWREKNVVSPVKAQRGCGSCWAFSVVGNVESINAIRTGTLQELSEQQLVDCDTTDYGCFGGDPIFAMKYLVKDGAMTFESYPYVGKDQKCKYKRGDVVVHVADCQTLSTDEQKIADQLVAIGPLSIAIDATHLRHYHTGVLTADACKFSRLNHAVLLVGYGVDSTSGLQYWLVKNSWSEKFGEKGYFRMQRGVNCLGFTSYPPVTAVIN